VNVIPARPSAKRFTSVRVVTNDVGLQRAVRRGLESVAGVDVRAHSAFASPANILVVDAAAPDAHGEFDDDSGATILVAPEIDADVREQGRRLDVVAYVRNDEGLGNVIGLVVELVAFTA
jgi:hypothetical protein